MNRYDLVASVFEAATHAVSLGLAPSIYRGVSNLLRVPRGSSVLEVGCGPATLTPYLLESTHDDISIIGIDVAPRLIAKANAKCNEHGWTRVQFVCADFDAYEPESPPAAIVFSLVLSALPNPNHAIQRALSLLPNGGQLIIADSIPSWRRASHWPASLYMHFKAAFLGARPSADMLAIAEGQLMETTQRTIGRGLYTLFAGRKIATTRRPRMPAKARDRELGETHQLHGVQPVLPVSDVAASAEYFHRVLGFEIDFLEGDPPIHGRVKVTGNWGHPVYIHLNLADPESVHPSGEIRIYVGHDLDGLFEAYRRLGVEVVFPPVSQPWGLREFAVREINQHVLRFCKEI